MAKKKAASLKTPGQPRADVPATIAAVRKLFGILASMDPATSKALLAALSELIAALRSSGGTSAANRWLGQQEQK